MREVVEALFFSGSSFNISSLLSRGPVVILAFVGLWSVNLFIFERYKIDYKRVLGLGGGEEVKDDDLGDCE